MKRIMALVVALLALGAGLGGAAQEESSMHRVVANPDIFLEVDLGYEDAVVYSRPMPLAVTIHNQGEDLSATVGVNIYRTRDSYDRYEAQVELPSGSVKQVTFPVKLMALQQTFTVEVVKDAEVLCAVSEKPQAAVSPYAMMVGVMAAEPQRLGYMNLTADKDELLRGEVWQCVSLNEENFPRDVDMLDGFAILTLADFDARLLDQAQQDALEQWLKKGGILILGGGGQAQRTYPYFERYTGLAAGTVSQGEDITPALMAYVGMDGKAQGGAFILNQPQGTASVLAGTQQQPLLMGVQAGSGYILVAAFELDAVSAWKTAPTLWQRVLLTCAPQVYSQALSGGNEGYDFWDVQSIISSIPVENQENLLGALAVLAAFLALAGPGAYLLLKKLDKRELMWGAVPLLTVAAAAVIWFISANTTLNQPIAVSVSTVRMDGANAKADILAGVASPQREGIVLSAADGTPIKEADTYYPAYDDAGDEEQLKEPYRRMYRYLCGQPMSIEYPATAPWGVNALTLQQDAAQIGQVTGSVWAQEDGLHARIENQTGYAFHNGYLITSLGYVSIPQLLPGETVEAALANGEEAPDAKAEEPSETPPGIVDGKLWRSRQSRYGSYMLDTNGLVDAIVYPERQLDPTAEIPDRELGERQMRQSLMVRVLPSELTCAYVGFNDDIGQVGILLGGQEVTRRAHKGILSAQLNYEAVGPTGLVHYMPGMLPTYQVEASGDQPPRITDEDTLSIGFDLSAGGQRMFGYLIPNAAGLEIEEMVLSAQYVEGGVAFRLLNHKTGAWDEQEGKYLSLTGAQAAPYVDGEGRVLVQAILTGGGKQSYGYVEKPFIEVKGRVK